jgi:hypothetical protein
MTGKRTTKLAQKYKCNVLHYIAVLVRYVDVDVCYSNKTSKLTFVDPLCALTYEIDIGVLCPMTNEE